MLMEITYADCSGSGSIQIAYCLHLTVYMLQYKMQLLRLESALIRKHEALLLQLLGLLFKTRPIGLIQS